jgi:hypothetical protein
MSIVYTLVSDHSSRVVCSAIEDYRPICLFSSGFSSSSESWWLMSGSELVRCRWEIFVQASIAESPVWLANLALDGEAKCRIDRNSSGTSTGLHRRSLGLLLEDPTKGCPALEFPLVEVLGCCDLGRSRHVVHT